MRELFPALSVMEPPQGDNAFHLRLVPTFLREEELGTQLSLPCGGRAPPRLRDAKGEGGGWPGSPLERQKEWGSSRPSYLSQLQGPVVSFPGIWFAPYPVSVKEVGPPPVHICAHR